MGQVTSQPAEERYYYNDTHGPHDAATEWQEARFNFLPGATAQFHQPIPLDNYQMAVETARGLSDSVLEAHKEHEPLTDKEIDDDKKTIQVDAPRNMVYGMILNADGQHQAVQTLHAQLCKGYRYVQGMSLILTLLLLTLNDALAAEKLYLALIAKLYPLYTSDNVLNSAVDQIMVSLKHELWELHWHFRATKYPEVMFRPILWNWVMTLFINLQPIDEVAHLMANIISMSDGAVLRLVALEALRSLDKHADAIMDVKVHDLLYRKLQSWNDPEKWYNKVVEQDWLLARDVCEKILPAVDAEKLIRCAFHRRINHRRFILHRRIGDGLRADVQWRGAGRVPVAILLHLAHECGQHTFQCILHHELSDRLRSASQVEQPWCSCWHCAKASCHTDSRTNASAT